MSPRIQPPIGEAVLHLLATIQAHLRRSGMSPTRFGRVVVNDPRFIHDFQNGREPRDAMCRRVIDWIAANGIETQGAGR